MKALKIIIVILILATGLVSSYLIVKNSKLAISDKPIKNSENLNNAPIAENPIQWMENATSSKNSSENNLTENISQDILDQIKSGDLLNQNDQNFASGIDLISGNLAPNILKNNQIDFNLISSISNTELKISQDNSREAKVKYLEATIEINKKDFAGFNKSYFGVILDVFQKLDSSSATQLADIYKNLANDYLNLNVPADWVNIHKDIIIYYKNAEIVYRAMANYSNDPIKGYLALETVNGLVEKVDQLQNTIIKKAQEIK